MSARLSGAARTLLLAYEDELGRRYAGRRLRYQLDALAEFLRFLLARGVEFDEAWPEDLDAWRTAEREGRQRAGRRFNRRRLDAVVGLYRFLYCHGYLGHDPSAVMELPKRMGRR